ncbi:uncharacterized protein LOC130763114 [Actinidia eriantha]|uniref:uncharacterized protein LOC130763114 n=1 Tax=Actinidia eriantha TaxID=165200 RepID=UPI0025836A5F|nr:uncharacterized protein LOC130763114 [Actinidia eriantha]
MAFKIFLILVFHVIALLLSVAAELRRSTATVRTDSNFNYNYCVYDSNISTWYGVGAALFLMASQVLVMVASQCFCCGKASKPQGSRAWAFLLFITCWVFFIIAEACLLVGSVTNTHHTKHWTIFGQDPPYCETLRDGVFATGAAFIFLNGIVSELYCVFFSNDSETLEPYDGEAAIALIP